MTTEDLEQLRTELERLREQPCWACGKPWAEHADALPASGVRPRMPCVGIKAYYSPRAPVVHEPAAPPALSRCSQCGFAYAIDEAAAANAALLSASLKKQDAELEKLRAAIARVEALCGACQGGPHHLIGVQFSRALRGAP